MLTSIVEYGWRNFKSSVHVLLLARLVYELSNNPGVVLYDKMAVEEKKICKCFEPRSHVIGL